MNIKVMEEDPLYKIITAALDKQLETDAAIEPAMRLKEDLGLPSIKLVFVITEVIGQLQLSIMDFYDYELLNLNTVSDIYTLLSKK